VYHSIENGVGGNMDQAMLQTLAAHVVALRVFRRRAAAIVDKEKTASTAESPPRHELAKRIGSQEYDPQQTR
jgi:hypothetical protein